MKRGGAGSWILALAAFFAISGCMPVQPSEQEVIGIWQVNWNCGIERLELKRGRSYVQDIEYRGGGHATHIGHTWRVIPKESILNSGYVVLQDAVEFCSVFGVKLAKPETGDRQLATVWEWGRLILSFNPDWQGFERH